MSSALKQDLSIGSNLKNLRKAAGLTQAPSSGPAGGAGPSHLHRDISQNGTGEIQHPHLCIKSSQGNLQARQLLTLFSRGFNYEMQARPFHWPKLEKAPQGRRVDPGHGRGAIAAFGL